MSYRLKTMDLPTSSEQERVRAYRDGDLPRTMALLEGEKSKHPLCVCRDEAWWRRLLVRGARRWLSMRLTGR